MAAIRIAIVSKYILSTIINNTGKRKNRKFVFVKEKELKGFPISSFHLLYTGSVVRATASVWTLDKYGLES